MCLSQTTLFYGVFVHTYQLVLASAAHAKIVRSLLGVDLLSLRAYEGRIRTSPIRSISRVPVEIWEHIREQLVDVALEDELREWLSHMRCGRCEMKGCTRPQNMRGRRRKRKDGKRIYDWRAWEIPACDECEDSFIEFTDELFNNYVRLTEQLALHKHRTDARIILLISQEKWASFSASMDCTCQPTTDSSHPEAPITTIQIASPSASHQSPSEFSSRVPRPKMSTL
ncbi:hypothetical protein P7C70_g4688, partial [Phenoliferia sp. Uapishka_3]